MMFSVFLASAALASADPELFEPGVISTGHDDAHVAFDPDGKSLYFIRNTPDFAHWTVLSTERTDNGWGEVALAPFSGRWSDADVFITRDGERLFFISTRPVDGVAREDSDIWMMRRAGEHWGEPQHIAELSSPGYEWFPTLTDKGDIYFGSEREGSLGKSDIWRARWQGDHFGEPENLGPLINSPDQEIEPLIAPDESWMIFAARGREPSAGAYDLYVAYQCAGEWTPAQPLKGGVNSEGWDFGPRFSPDGAAFYFTSNRADTSSEFTDVDDLKSFERMLSSPRNGLRDVYEIDPAALEMESPCGATDAGN